MSIQVVSSDTDTCAFPDCDEEFNIHNAVRGSYCSMDCADRHTGRKKLRNLRQDHRFCWSCWRPRKEIETPTDEARRGLGPITDQALVGYEYHTRHVEMGPHGLECECGAVDHDIDDVDWRDDVPYHWLLYLYIKQQVREGQDSRMFDLETFADTLWHEDDLELAVGRALD